MTAKLYHNFNICATCQAMVAENERLRTELDATRALLISPGWGVPISGKVLADIHVLARVPGQPGAHVETEWVDVALFDLDYLKQLNIAAGSQGRTNEWIRPALTMRREGDHMLRGQVDGADMFMALFAAGTGDAGMAYIEAELAAAPMTDAERLLFVRAVCRRRDGPLFGDMRYLLHRLGWRIAQPPHPTLTKRMCYGVHVSKLEQLFHYGDRAVFDQKAARGVGR